MPTEPQTEEKYARTLAEWDWVYTERYPTRLHHLADLGEIVDEVRFHGATTTCGRTGDYRIPGLFSRMGVPRCALCCQRLGIARGKGSPKNDAALRPWVESRLARLKREP